MLTGYYSAKWKPDCEVSKNMALIKAVNTRVAPRRAALRRAALRRAALRRAALRRAALRRMFGARKEAVTELLSECKKRAQVEHKKREQK